MDHEVAAAGAMALMALLLAARLAPNPAIGFVLQSMGVGGAIGLMIAYARHRDDPNADRWRTVTAFALGGLLLGCLLVLADHLSSATP